MIPFIQMKITRIALFLFTLLVPAVTLAQLAARKGSITLNDGTVMNGYINYKNWRKSPVSVEFSTSGNGPFATYDRTTIDAFSIEDAEIIERYQLFNVVADTSEQAFAQMSRYPYAETELMPVFLRQLVTGKFNLYEMSQDGERMQFFYSNADATPLELVHKFFKGNETHQIENNTYIDTLKLKMSGCEPAQKLIGQLKYTRKLLVQVAEAYNKCLGDTNFVTTKDFKNPVRFMVGASVQLLKATSASKVQYVGFGSINTTFPSLYITMEKGIDRSNNLLSFLIAAEVFQQTLKKDYQPDPYHDNTLNISLTAINLEIGLRKYFYLAKVRALADFRVSNVLYGVKENSVRQTYTFNPTPEVTEGKFPGRLRSRQPGLKLTVGAQLFDRLEAKSSWMIANGFSPDAATAVGMRYIAVGLGYYL